MMENYEKAPAYRLSLMTQFLQVGSDISVWCMNREGRIYYSTSPKEDIFHTFLELGGCKAYALGFREERRPFVVSDTIGLIWFGEFSDLTERLKDALVLVGPCFPLETPRSTIEQRLLELDITPSLRSAGRHTLFELPVLSPRQMHQYIRMLHFAATDQVLALGTIVYQNMYKEDVLSFYENAEEKAERPVLDYESAYQREKLLLQCVEEGNLNYRDVTELLRMRGDPIRYQTGNPIRDVKDAVIIFLARCSDAAIRGGLSFKAAKDMEIQAVRKIEKCRTLTDLAAMREELVEEYIVKVNSLKRAGGLSQPVQACCEYIQAHFMEKIELADIAKNAGYTEYYLTRRFHEEMGIRLSQYLTDVRIRYAKTYLLTTEKTIQEISELLQFGSRNYFTQVFKKSEGMTPQDFRDRRIFGGPGSSPVSG